MSEECNVQCHKHFTMQTEHLDTVRLLRGKRAIDMFILSDVVHEPLLVSTASYELGINILVTNLVCQNYIPK